MLPKEEFCSIFSACGFEISDEQFEKFSIYARLLVEWNEKVNLTAITDPYGICVKHFVDSLLPFKQITPEENAKLIDVGTGAGFPAVPLKILRPDIKITLLDSLNKRVNFLQQLSKELDISAQCIHGRAEEMGNLPEFRDQFDIATARAVAELSALCEYCVPFVKIGGSFIALKGSTGAVEAGNSVNAVNVLGGEISNVHEYSLPNGDGRTLVCVKKISHTPPQYPRNKGRMTKKPL